MRLRSSPSRKAFSCATCSESPAREVVFVYTAEASGQLVIQHSATGAAAHSDPLLHVRTACDDVTTEVGCNDDSSLSDTLDSLLVLDAVEGTTYYLFADGYDLEEEGAFELRLRIEE